MKSQLLFLPVLILIVIGLMVAGCSTDQPTQPSNDRISLEKKPVDPTTGEGSFTFEAKYDYFKSYPGGTGIFLLRINPGADLTGDVAVSVNANKTLNAQLTSAVVNAGAPIVELTFSPTRQATFGVHVVTVTATNQTQQVSVDLEIELVSWGIASMNVAQDKHAEFVDWLSDVHPELGNFNNQQWDIYSTYPRVVVVEHYTFLSDDWEFRICFHVMIPPDDWSMMMIRPRGEWDAILAARREWNETSQTYEIFEIPIEDYPTFYGY